VIARSSFTSSGGWLTLTSGDSCIIGGAVTIDGGNGIMALGGSIMISSGVGTLREFLLVAVDSDDDDDPIPLRRVDGGGIRIRGLKLDGSRLRNFKNNIEETIQSLKETKLDGSRLRRFGSNVKRLTQTMGLVWSDGAGPCGVRRDRRGRLVLRRQRAAEERKGRLRALSACDERDFDENEDDDDRLGGCSVLFTLDTVLFILLCNYGC